MKSFYSVPKLILSAVSRLSLTLASVTTVALTNSAYADYQIDQLMSCDKGFRQIQRGMTRFPRKDDVAIIREWRLNSGGNIADDLHLFQGNKAFKIELPVYEQHYLTKAKRLIVTIQNKDYCLHYRIRSIADDDIEFFKPMPAAECSGGGTHKVTAIEEVDQAKLKFRKLLLKNIQNQVGFFRMSQRDAASSEPDTAAYGKKELSDFSRDLIGWDPSACFGLEDPEFKRVITQLKDMANLQIESESPAKPKADPGNNSPSATD